MPTIDDLIRVFLGWLRGERGHCRMVAIPIFEEEDAKRPSRERESLVGEPSIPIRWRKENFRWLQKLISIRPRCRA